jgi:hypothetical protein
VYKLQVKTKDKVGARAYVSQGPSSHLPGQGSSGAVMCPRGSGARLPAQGSSGGTICPHGSGSHLLARDSSRSTTCPRGSGSRLPARGSSGAAMCRLGSNTRLLTQDSSGAASCPVDRLYKWQAIEQIFPIMFEGSWAFMSRHVVKTLCREIMAAAPAPKAAPHRKWVETPIGFDSSDWPKEHGQRRAASAAGLPNHLQH